MPDATVLVSTDGVILHANRRIEDLLGWPVAELIGQPIECLVPTAISRRHVSLRRGFFETPQVRMMGSGLELDALHRSGAQIAVEISLSPLDVDGDQMVVAAIRGVGEQRALRQAIVAERNRAQGVIDALPDGMLELDIDAGRYTTVNPRFCELVGLSDEEILATSGIPPWWSPDDIDATHSAHQRAADGELVRYEMTLRHRSGRVIPVMVTSSTMVHDGHRLLLDLFHDVTEERRVAAELDDARAKVAVLDDRDRIARDLHDGVVQRLFAAGLQLQSSIGRPDQNTRMLSVIDDIDEAIKEIRTTIFKIHGRRWLDSGMVDALEAAMAESSRLLGHQPTLVVRGEVGLISDELGTELLAVARELLSNVLKHAEASETTVRLDVDDAQVSLAIEDDGVGFSADANHPGSGIKNIHERARQLGGSAVVSRRTQRGTVVRWTVPRWPLR